MHWLVLSTLPHFLSILPVLDQPRYASVIFLSTTLSILYHANKESNAWINRLDHIVATIWFLYDIQLGLHYSVLGHVLEANLVSFLLHMGLSRPYYLHNLWHFVNAYKCWYVSSLLKSTLHPLGHLHGVR